MEVVPTSDGGDDDGVIWFRCPQCQGFLPKLSGADLADEQDEPAADDSAAETKAPQGTSADPKNDALPWDSPADMMAAQKDSIPEVPPAELEDAAPGDLSGHAGDRKPPAQPDEAAEPLHEYAALLAEKDQSEPTPYRPWESYEVGQCIHHQAWEECGVVVAKEKLPGNRQVIKCYFEEAGVVRLIEMAPR